MIDSTCRTCCKPLSAPYRRYDERGRVTEGCVAVDHDGHLVTPSESARWHNRPEAKAIRKATADHLKTILGGRRRVNRAVAADTRAHPACDCGWIHAAGLRAITLHAPNCAVRAA